MDLALGLIPAFALTLVPENFDSPANLRMRRGGNRRIQSFTIQEPSGIIWSILYRADNIISDRRQNLDFYYSDWHLDGAAVAVLASM
jgi:hypothetical protein